MSHHWQETFVSAADGKRYHLYTNIPDNSSFYICTPYKDTSVYVYSVQGYKFLPYVRHICIHHSACVCHVSSNHSLSTSYKLFIKLWPSDIKYAASDDHLVWMTRERSVSYHILMTLMILFHDMQ